MADAEGPNWPDERIAEAFACRTRTLVDTLPDGFPEWEQLGPSEAERRWRAKLRSAQKQDEPMAVRDSLRTGRPLGSPGWVEGVAARLGIDLTPRPRGRPRKEESASIKEARKMN